MSEERSFVREQIRDFAPLAEPIPPMPAQIPTPTQIPTVPTAQPQTAPNAPEKDLD